jgi:hypothetical protein
MSLEREEIGPVMTSHLNFLVGKVIEDLWSQMVEDTWNHMFVFHSSQFHSFH